MQYPTIAQPQYGFAPTMPMMPSMSDMPPAMMNFKKGGLASLSLPEMAERVEAAGRNGDTMLAHITPEEAGILQLLGGSGTINPYTGQPEYFKKFLKKVVPKPIYKLGSSIGKELERGVEKVAKELGPVGQIAAAYFGGPIGAALYAGLAPEGSSFDVKRAALAGGLTYAGTGTLKPSFDYSSAFGGEAAAAAPIEAATAQTAAEAAAGTPSVVESVNSAAGAGSGESLYSLSSTAPQAPVTASSDYMLTSSGSTGQGLSALNSGQGFTIDPASPQAASLGQSTPSFIDRAGTYLANLPEKTLNYAIKNPIEATFIGTQVAAAGQAKKELDAQKAEAERVLAEQEKYTANEIAFAKDVLRRYPVEYRRLSEEDVAAMGMAAGGLASLNTFKTGGQPRFLDDVNDKTGRSDGMADGIRARIGGVQEARLADGEFVIPADVVSHLGNGSSKAGAKKLYMMMNRIRKARTGKKRQAPEVKAERYMPA